jgi:predicted flap endonuclease-1-like 5' DNA nuclease
MKWLIALLTAATGVLHILFGFNVIGGGTGNPFWMLVANGAGYLVLLALFLTTSGSTRRTIRWILLAYTLITLVGYFILNGEISTWPMIIKAIELLLVILLFLDRGSDEVAVPVAARTATAVDTTATRAYSAGDESIGKVAVAAERAYDQITEPAEGAVDQLADAGDEALDSITTTAETAGDRLDDAGDEAVDRVTGVAEDIGDAVSDAGEEAVDMASRMGDAVVGAGLAAGAALTAAVTGDEDQVSGGDEPTSEEVRTNLEEYLKSFGSSSEFNRDIEYIEGIGQAYGGKLRAVGVNKVIDLMVNASTRRGRKQLSDSSGIAQSLILTWVNHIDLFRIKGVAQEYADLLEQSGVDTVVELAQRNPVNLHKRMAEINEEKKLVRRLPHASDVQSWVEQAKELPRLIFY